MDLIGRRQFRHCALALQRLVLGAQAALDAKMIDGIATMDEVMRKMQRNAKAQPARSSRSLTRVQSDIASVA